MRFVTYIILFLNSVNLLSQSIFHQPISDTVYYRTYGGLNFDEAKDFYETSDGGFILAGTSSSFGNGNTSFYLVKTDSMGIFKWSKTIGGTNNDWCRSLEKSFNNGNFLAGYSNSFSNFDYDGYCVLTDSLGNIIWEKTIGGSDWDFIYGSCSLSDSGYVLCGETYSNALGGSDAYLVRINKNGDTLWTKKFSSQNDEVFNDVIIIGNSIFACGKFYNTDSLKNMGMIAKYDLNGTLLDTLLYGPEVQHNFNFNFLNKTNDYSFLTGGEKKKFSGPNPSSSLLMRIDTNLVVVWNTYPGYQSQRDCVFGFENSSLDIISLNIQDGSFGGKATYILYLNPTNSFFDGGTQDGSGNDLLYKGLITRNNRMAFCGGTSTFGTGNSDFWLVIFKKDSIYFDTKINLVTYTDTLPLSLISVDETKSRDNITQLYPNPLTKNEDLIINGISGKVEIKIYDLQGRNLRTNEYFIEGKNKLSYNINELESGVYLMEIQQEKSKNKFKILVRE